jgi:hypothetical protein
LISSIRFTAIYVASASGFPKLNQYMNFRKIFILPLVLPFYASAQFIFQDEFDGTSLNPISWESSTPFGDSSVTVGSSQVSLANGAGILSRANFPTAIEIAFTFSFTGGSYDSFRVVSRADDFYPAGYSIQNWVGISFRIQEDTGNLSGNVSLEDHSGIYLASTTIPISQNVQYSIIYRDDGNSISAFLNGSTTPFITAETAAVYGNRVGMWNREGAGAGSFISAGSVTSISTLTISAIPEPKTYATLAGLGACFAIILKRHISTGSPSK